MQILKRAEARDGLVSDCQRVQLRNDRERIASMQQFASAEVLQCAPYVFAPPLGRSEWGMHAELLVPGSDRSTAVAVGLWLANANANIMLRS